jgi:hypothetical protein
MTLALAPKARILVVTLRRLCDLLLTTPLIRNLKRACLDTARGLAVPATGTAMVGCPGRSSPRRSATLRSSSGRTRP